MPGEALVQINSKQWTCSVSNTFTELTQGLSGVSSMPAGTGMLFDLGGDYSTIQIDMSRMLFPLDIIFINSTQGVVGVLHNVQPGEDASLQNDTLPGARCFLEINAGEAEEIEVGDNVDIQGYAQTATSPIDLLLGVMPYLVLLFMTTKMMDMALEEPEEKPKLPQGYTTIKAPPTRKEIVEQFRRSGEKTTAEQELLEKKTTLENTGREIAQKAGVEFVRLDEGWQVKYATPRYWFKDSTGHEIVATDLEELKWKLSRRSPQVLIPQTEKQYVKIITPGQTCLAMGSVVTLEELERENRKARERGENPATAEIWVGGKPTLMNPKLVPTKPGREQKENLEFLPDSPEFLAYTIDDIGYRERIDNVFQQAIVRAKGAK